MNRAAASGKWHAVPFDRHARARQILLTGRDVAAAFGS
jgi:hypothetical protein